LRNRHSPSDYPELARWLVERGITSISLNPDAVVKTAFMVADVETRGEKQKVSAD
jgi:pyruvate, water dikinase